MVKILFFGILASKTGTKELELDIGSGKSVAELLQILKERFNDMPDGPFVFAVNETQATLETIINDNDEVAVMPPFSGG